MGTINLYLSTTKYDKQNVCIFLGTYSRCLISEIDMLLVQIAPINTSPSVFWQYQSMLISPPRHGLYPHCLTGTVIQLGSNKTLWLLIFYFSKFKQADTRASCLGGQINMTLHICWVPASTKNSKSPYLAQKAYTLCPHGLMNMMLHIFRARYFQWTWFGVNQPSGCPVPVSAKFKEFSSCPRAQAWYTHGQMTMTYISRQELAFEWIGPVVAEFHQQQDFRGLYHTHGDADYAPMCTWS